MVALFNGLLTFLLIVSLQSAESFVPNNNLLGIVPKNQNGILNGRPVVDFRTKLEMGIDLQSTSELLSSVDLNIGRDQAEALAGPFFGASLFPYLAFLYFLNVEENECPKGVTVGFATCLLFVFLTIPAAIAAQLLYGVSLADSDWLHGSAESLLTITNLVTVVAFRQALEAKEKDLPMPISSTKWAPMTWLVVGLTGLATLTAIVPAVAGPNVHTP